MCEVESSKGRVANNSALRTDADDLHRPNFNIKFARFQFIRAAAGPSRIARSIPTPSGLSATVTRRRWRRGDELHDSDGGSVGAPPVMQVSMPLLESGLAWGM